MAFNLDILQSLNCPSDHRLKSMFMLLCDRHLESKIDLSYADFNIL